MHTCVSCEGFPLTIQISYGTDHDREHFVEVMEDIKVKTNRRPRTRPLEVLADAAYDDVDIRQHLRSRGIQSNIPINPRNTKKRKRGRPTRFNPETYIKRGAIERFFAWLKMGFRRLTTRYERLNIVFKGFLDIACFMMCWKRGFGEIVK
ncbi:MAG: transposase [Methanolobus sp.]|uniref:transposase n=1 Tax=Methanolobus sp. TaxID=1874737 RepID=UPI002731FE59|nr:transposase [Methanolobus sp.]MDP2218436.1 transposase [Methanolobus sp.]